MRFIIEDPDPALERKLLDLIASHRPAVSLTVDANWTAHRAATLLRNLPENAARVIEGAVLGEGYVSAASLREQGDGSLRGHTGAISQALTRGVRLGWWPEGLPAPVESEYNAKDAKSPARAAGFRLLDGLLPVFQEAVAKVDDMAFGTTPLSALTRAVRTDGGTWTPARTIELLESDGRRTTPNQARALLRSLAKTGVLVPGDTAGRYHAAAEEK